MLIHIGADHAGYEMKQKLIALLKSMKYEVKDHGAYDFMETDDYPDYIEPVAQAVHNNPNPREVRGIILGGSGQGEAMLANRFPGVRAVVFNGETVPSDGREIPDEIFLSRSHNDSNVLSLGARFLSEQEAETALKKWLDTPFSEEDRHKRRIQKLEDSANRAHVLWKIKHTT